jgi:hypothetical protein
VTILTVKKISHSSGLVGLRRKIYIPIIQMGRMLENVAVRVNFSPKLQTGKVFYTYAHSRKRTNPQQFTMFRLVNNST